MPRPQEQNRDIRNPRPGRGITVYLAGPLFTQAEWLWNGRLAAELRRKGYDVILPQDKGTPRSADQEPVDLRALFSANLADIKRADVIVAILDGADPDSGTSWECGYGFGLGRPVIGLRTDFRGGGEDSTSAVNLMLTQSCREMILIPAATRDDLPGLCQLVCEAIARSRRKN